MDSRRSILVVEDDNSIRNMMKTLLEIEGYTVLTACNGEQGIRAIQSSTPPNVILLDMMMPVMSGWDFLDFVRTNAQTAKIPVIVVSAYDEIGKSVGPSAFVSKPVQLQALLDAVEKCVA